MNDLKIRQLAIDTRRKLGLSPSEYFDVYRAIFELGVTCVKRPLESQISGATLKTQRVNLILINSNKSLGHQNFTVAHELYHCLYDEGLINKACSIGSLGQGPSSERIADRYAKHLLMPEDGILNQLRIRGKSDETLGLVDIINLEQFFAVSRKAMLWRLQELKLIQNVDEEKYGTNIIRGVRSFGKSDSLYKATNEEAIISDYAERAFEALEKDLITDSRYEEILADAGLFEGILGEIEEVDIVD